MTTMLPEGVVYMKRPGGGTTYIRSQVPLHSSCSLSLVTPLLHVHL